MGCGSSKSAVAAVTIAENQPPPTPKTQNDDDITNNNTTTENQKNEDVKMSEPKHDILRVAAIDDGESLSDIEDSENLKNLKNSTNNITTVKSAFIEDVKDASIKGGDVCFGSVESLRDNVINTSVKSLKKLNSRECSATSRNSKDSGCVRSGRSSRTSQRNGDEGAGTRGSVTSLQSKKSKESERVDSGTSQTSVTGKKTSSARQRLLRIQDDLCNDNSSDNSSDKENNNNNNNNNSNNNNNKDLENLGENVICRPKSRFGNVAFDIVLDTPETGNAKKRPDKLPSLSKKQGKPKKRKTKKDIDKKLEEAEVRRKIAEGEKLLKAKQFQHFSVVTQVETFKPPQSGDEDDEQQEQEKLLQEELQRLEHEEEDATMVEKSFGVPVKTSHSLPMTSSVTSSRGGGVEQTAIESFHMDDEDEDDGKTKLSLGLQQTSPNTVAAY